MTVTLRFLGQSAFLLDDGQHKLLLDPFITGNPVCPVQLEEALNWDISAVLISHAHGDHWGNALDFGKKGVPVIGTAEIGNYAKAKGTEHAVGMNIGGTYKAEWGSVYLTPAWHSSSFPDGTYGGMPTGMVIEFGAQRLYFAGDTCLFGDMKLIGDRKLDAALLPVGDHYTMGPEEAARCLELLRPRVAIPMHYATFPALTGDPEVFAREGRKQGVDVRVLKPGDTTQL
ncbi:metal-dependent hydrolase [Deinococcus sp.]|uniref:metal-dependent hydrolase n=1 Tax=Deinococcus sp. TaxID=47478 RepID=UPI0025C73A3A|nr:metal-dependent hydrolase [Deinococcus sp.]